MNVIWHGTASIELENEEGKILFDPFVPLEGSKVAVTLEDYDGFSDIFVTHGHFDHIYNIPEIIKRNPNAKVYCTNNPYCVLRKKGVPEINLQRINYDDELKVNGFNICVIHGKHAELPRASFYRLKYMLKSPAKRNLPLVIRENRICTENDETVMYLIEADGKKLCLMGSLNLRDEIEYPEHADLLILPYNGWEDNFSPAVKTIERLKPKKVLLDHYDDTFPPITMPLDLSPILKRHKGHVSVAELNRKIVV